MSTRTTTVRTRQATRTGPQTQDTAVISDNKENFRMNGSLGKVRATKRGAKIYCLCKKPDDGSPMIHCSSCKDWYHFRCVELSETDAEEIQHYVCPSCHEKTGARTIISSISVSWLSHCMIVPSVRTSSRISYHRKTSKDCGHDAATPVVPCTSSLSS
ncbi:hypothetical protein BD309DRAFT_1013470 [Dichomitus squalens]|nr:hypothetical protein BD309DRAFT_1013470 [Dichomitus squalens]